MSGFIVRRATQEDKEDILRIHDNVYSGLDYLPDYFDDFMKDPLITSYVYETSGEIIGYLASHVVDNGQTVIDRAGRVSPRYIGTGVYRRILAEVEQANRQIGHVTRNALVKIEPPAQSFRDIYTHVTTRSIHSYEFQLGKGIVEERVKRQLINQRLQNIFDTMPDIYLKGSYSRYLFSEKRILLDWVPFRPLESNISIMKGKNTVFVSDVHVTSAGVHTGLLSASSIYRPHHSVDVSCTVDIYGNDYRTVKDHLVFHLRRLCQIYPVTVSLAIISNLNTDPAIFDNTLRTLGIERLCPGPGVRNQPEVYEKYL